MNPQNKTTGRKSRVTRAAKPDRKTPAKLVPFEPAPPPHVPVNHEDSLFNAKAIAERLDIWRLNAASGPYFAPMKSGEDWREMSGSDLRRLLKAEGVRTKEDDRDPEFLSEADRVLEFVQNYRLVDFAGPLAGHRAGVHLTKDGRPLIVRGGPKLIPPEEGDFSLIREILEPRFQDSAEPQLDFFLFWLKRGMEPLYHGRIRKGPILILAGPNDAGKSFIQQHIITPLFGGREFDPTEFFKNESGFNKYMMASESLVIGEFAFPLDGANRLMLSEKFKKIVANDSQTYHPKGRDAMTMHPHFRLSISINDNEEKLRALPPMNNDLIDKVVLLKVRGGLSMPMPTNTDEEEASFANAVRAQLPAFAYYLLNWQPPEKIAIGRFGMQVWQHPEIVDSLWAQEPASRFAFLLDLELFPADERGGWEKWGPGKAVALYEEMTRDGAPHAKQFTSVARGEGGFSQMLGTLARKEGLTLARERGIKLENLRDDDPARRYAKSHKNFGNLWEIRPPKE
jgi:Family of unknown function (DUF5906)